MNRKLIEERERLGLQQKQVYDSIKVGKSTYYRWESGTPIPSDKLTELAKLGFDVGYLVTGKRTQLQQDGVVCFSKQNLQEALAAFLYNTAELGLLNKSPDANVESLVNMAMFSLFREIGETYQPDVIKSKSRSSK
ncbi:helix-turn-helix transcriptional regulator [Pseudoalteromonas sp. PS5]|uniref:helix-turn-helix domain-containing protein n=1 Tax=Pseudoalteromonas sp. PS5 TaxID=1437473 RepID=UPI000FFF3414|nr:helix-turn-helix transcriptional regulator [Pseudoalteromonas sp. PS5]RXE95571.1 XRE family transcriptional regulator [Pseudoalteromonas sp. PS5]